MNDSYTKPGKTVAEKALELHEKSIMAIEYNKNYKLSDIIHNISKANSRIISYIFLSSCRGVSDETGSNICGNYKLNFGLRESTRTVGEKANILTKHFIEEINDKMAWLPEFANAISQMEEKDEILNKISSIRDGKYIPIMKYIFYHLETDNFKLFTNFIKKIVYDGQISGIMYIINAEALCFIYEISRRAEAFYNGYTLIGKSFNTEIILIKKEHREEYLERIKNFIDNKVFDPNFNSFLNGDKITEKSQKIFTVRTKN